MAITCVSSLATGEKVAGVLKITKIFTIFKITETSEDAEPDVHAIGDFQLGAGGPLFHDPVHVIIPDPEAPVVTYFLFVKHVRNPHTLHDIEFLRPPSTVADFTVSITINNHPPVSGPIKIPPTFAHPIPC